MPELIVWLVKANISLCLFFGAYRFALRKLTFYSLNRLFLITGILFSALYPLINVPAFLSEPQSFSGELIVLTQNISISTIYEPVKEFNYWSIVVWLFWLGSGWMTLRLCLQFLSLLMLHRRSEADSLGEYRFRKIRGEVTPFSFLHHIYLNPAQHGNTELMAILKHEQIHVKDYHSLDVLLAEINLVFFWFNPISWFMKQSVRENLEFITDQKVLNKGTDRREYQYSLAGIGNLARATPLGNNFNFLTIKKRIAMMNKKRSSRVQISRYILILPLLVAFAFIVSVSKAGIEPQQISSFIKTIPERITAAAPGTETKEIRKDETKPAKGKQNSSVKKLVVKLRGDSTTRQATSLPVTVSFYIDGEKSDKSTVEGIKPVDIESINVLKGKSAIELGGTENENGVVVITTKQNKNDQKVIAFNSRVAAAASVRSDSARSGASVFRINGKASPLIVIDGKVAETTTLSAIAPETIESVSVLKDAGATKIYGERGKEGVVLVTTKKFATTLDAQNEVVSILDPATLTSGAMDNIKRKFADQGLSVNFDENYSGKVLKDLGITVKSPRQSASAKFSITELKKNGYLIMLKAHPQTGQVTVVSVKKNN